MARSIHDTLGVARRALADNWSDREIPRAIAAEMRKNWLRQQAIREGERRVRQSEPPPAPVDPAQVPIIIEEEAPHLLYGVTEEDIREVLGRLPPGSLDGLREVRLCVDRGGDPKEAQLVREPYTGRMRGEYLPNLFAPEVLGSYHPSTATIRLYAFVGELEPCLTMFWKIEALKTLVHEAAHHFDRTFRRGRARWSTDERSKDEAWAEEIEQEQVREIVFPYIKTRYLAELDALDAWIERHSGAATFAVELAFLFRRPLMILLRSVLGGDELEATRVDFARALHEESANEQAAAVLRSVYAVRPEHAEAFAVSACILHCTRADHDEAERLCRRALELAPGCLAAWEVLVRGYAIQERWHEAAVACKSALFRTPAGDRPNRYFVSTLEEAHYRIGDWRGVDADADGKRARVGTWADAHEVLASCWSGQWKEALLKEWRLSAAGLHDKWSEWLAAVKFECAHRLDRPEQAGRFDEASLRALEADAFTEEWARRIRSHIGAVWGERD